MRITAASLVFISTVAAAMAQSPVNPPKDLPPSKSPMRDTERPIVVEGCIRGDRLTIVRDDSLTLRLLGASEFILQGPKETLKRLQTDHDGHQDEISGIVIIPASEAPPDMVTKEIGKRTRIVAGSGSSTTSSDHSQQSSFKPLRLKFGSVRHLAEKCSIPG